MSCVRRPRTWTTTTSDLCTFEEFPRSVPPDRSIFIITSRFPFSFSISHKISQVLGIL